MNSSPRSILLLDDTQSVQYRSDIADQLHLPHSANSDPDDPDDPSLSSSSSATPQNVSYLIPPLRLNASDRPLVSYFSKSVVFLGMINNAEHTLPHILQQLDAVSCVFRHSLFLFFESNSEDQTTVILEDWRQNKSFEPGTALFDSFCAQIIDEQIRENGENAVNHVQSVRKQVIYGDDIVRSELTAEIKKRSNSTYIHSLSRVEKFVPYRNMLLSELRTRCRRLTEDEGIEFDYLWMIDPDVFDINLKVDHGAMLVDG